MTTSPTTKQRPDVGLLPAIASPLFLGWLLPAISDDGLNRWQWWSATPPLSFLLIAPRTLRQPYQWWMALGHALGWFNSHIILGAVFLLVLQPIAFLMRLTGYDPLRRRNQQLTTYREERHTAGINLNRIF